MRLALALSIVAVSAAGAHAAEDRYGPPRAASVAPTGQLVASALPAGANPYNGQLLSWGGKAPTQAPAVAAAPPAPVMPQPIAAWAGPAPTPQRVSYPSIAAPVAQTPVAYTPQSPAPQGVAAAPLPTSLYDRPTAPAPQAYAPPAAKAPAPQAAPPPMQQAAAEPQRPPMPAAPQPTQPYQAPRAQAAATLPPPPSNPVRTSTPDEARPRAYSVLREFGGTPDPIDIPPPTSYWATRPETAPPPEDATDATADFGSAGGVGAEEVSSADSLSEEEVADKRRERAEARKRAAAAEAGK
jgi:hypothetical protein